MATIGYSVYGILARSKPILRKLEEWIPTLANLAVIFGLFFAYYTIKHSSDLERRRAAIEAVIQVRTADFQKSLARLKTFYAPMKTGDKTFVLDNSTTDDINQVMNVYDHIAILYINDVADRCIIKESIYSAVKELSSILDACSYPHEYRKNFNTLLHLMDQVYCGDRVSQFN
jgi:hypothetical protein